MDRISIQLAKQRVDSVVYNHLLDSANSTYGELDLHSCLGWAVSCETRLVATVTTVDSIGAAMPASLMDATKQLIVVLSRCVEIAAAVIIAIAALEATLKALFIFIRRGSPPQAKTEVRLTLGRWLAVGWQRD